MSYAARFPDAYAFQEVAERLYKMLDAGKCVVCHTATYFLDYSLPDRPRFFCGTGCYVQATRPHFTEKLNDPARRGNSQDVKPPRKGDSDAP